MNFINKHALQAAILAVSLVTSLATARAGHVYAGIIDTDGISGLGAGDALAFVSTSTGLAITGASLGTQTMSLVSVGSQTGYYMTSNISFTGLSNGLNWTGSAYRAASPYAALSGSYIVMQIASITGPDGAQFSFWDESISTTTPASTYTVGSGLIGLPYINLTDPSLLVSDGQGGYVAQGTSGVDPYGHIHGRSFTVDTPGTYTVSYILHDLNGQQADSAPFVVTYGAVPEPASVAMILGAVVLLSVMVLRRRRKVTEV